MFHSNVDSKITISRKKKLSENNKRYRGYIFSKKNWNKKPTLYGVFIEYQYNLNTIQFFSQTRNRKCMKLGYDFKTLLLSAEKIF
jgi:hypothetical protein